jgi:multisubunit Na+/H+ antiporter MnhE subunit
VSSRLRGWLIWFVALNALWLVFISAFVVAEEVLGVVASAIAATAAEAVREQGLTRFKPRARWFLKLWVLPWRAVSETWLVLWALVTYRRGVHGRFRVVQVSLPEDPDERSAKRALLTAAEGFAPNAYVLVIDREGRMLTHELVERG